MESRIINARRLFQLTSILGFLLIVILFSWTRFSGDGPLHVFLPAGGGFTWGQALYIVAYVVVRVAAMAALVWLIGKARSTGMARWRVLLVVGIVAIVSANLAVSLVFDYAHWCVMAIRDYLILLLFLFPALSSGWKALPMCLVLAFALLMLYLKFPAEPSLNPDYATTFSGEEAEQLFNRYVSLCNYVFDIFVVCCWVVAHNATGRPESGGFRVMSLVILLLLAGIMVVFFPYTPMILLVPAYAGACVFLMNRLSDLA